MVLVGISDLDDETASKYPGIHEYGQCQSKAFIKGMFAFFAGGAGGFTAWFAIRQKYPKFPAVYNVVFIAGGAIVSSYAVASITSKQCQKLWVNTAHHQDSLQIRDSNLPALSKTPSQATDEVPMKTTKYGDRMG
ncbi:transmembrane protein 141-like [Asterias amurensis]|uniref:transmembrane protein 141-like n=1 Tax=Asterias amurensis TaxID=7602 RepID=UPI003AB66EB9